MFVLRIYFFQLLGFLTAVEVENEVEYQSRFIFNLNCFIWMYYINLKSLQTLSVHFLSITKLNEKN